MDELRNRRAPAGPTAGPSVPLTAGSEALIEALRPRIDDEIARLRQEGQPISESEICGVLGALYVGRTMRAAPLSLRPEVRLLFTLSVKIGQAWQTIDGASDGAGSHG